MHVTYSMLNFSIRDGQSHPDAVVQLKTLLTGYLMAAEAEAAKKRIRVLRRTPRPNPLCDSRVTLRSCHGGPNARSASHFTRPT